MNIPGVAQLQNVIAANAGGFLGHWTVLDHDTQLSVVSFDSFYQFGYNKQTAISQYPIENGSFATYNKQNSPFSLTVTLIKNGLNLPFQKRDFVSKLQEYCDKPLLVDVVTTSGTYLSCTLGGLQFHNAPEENSDMIMADLTISEVRLLFLNDVNSKKIKNAFTREKQGFKAMNKLSLLDLSETGNIGIGL